MDKAKQQAYSLHCAIFPSPCVCLVPQHVSLQSVLCAGSLRTWLWMCVSVFLHIFTEHFTPRGEA